MNPFTGCPGDDSHSFGTSWNGGGTFNRRPRRVAQADHQDPADTYGRHAAGRVSEIGYHWVPGVRWTDPGPGEFAGQSHILCWHTLLMGLDHTGISPDIPRLPLRGLTEPGRHRRAEGAHELGATA